MLLNRKRIFIGFVVVLFLYLLFKCLNPTVTYDEHTFDYLGKKILEAPFTEEPFRHLHIANFLKDEHFKALMSNGGIHFPPTTNHDDLLMHMDRLNYTVVPFPSCTDNLKMYLSYMANGSYVPDDRCIIDNCYDGVVQAETLGIVFRLTPQQELTKRLMQYLNSENFRNIMLRKFELPPFTINWKRTGFNLQKYLKGYKISPHPDIKTKKITFLLNMNDFGDPAVQDNINTLLYQIKPEYQSKWNPVKSGRLHYPWDWFEFKKAIANTNDLLIFSPHDESIHSITLHYNHLPYQRTLITGNVFEVDP